MNNRTGPTFLLHPATFFAVLVVVGLRFLYVAQTGGEFGWSTWLWLLALLVPGVPLVTLGVARLESWWKYSVHRIGYTCPHCSHHGLPHFRCRSCSHKQEALAPTWSGLFTAPCENPKCSQRLPTLDFLGRLDLPKLCARCGQDLVNTDLGRKPSYFFPIWGAASSGKTNILVTSVWQLLEQFAGGNDLEVSFADPAEATLFNGYVKRLKAGEVMAKTAAQKTPRALTLTVDDGGAGGCLLYLYDAAGEDFVEEERLADHPVNRYDGILLVIDPFAEEGTRGGPLGSLSAAEVQKVNAASVEAVEILGRLLGALEVVWKVPPGVRIPIPVAVAVTKVDACGLSKRLGLAGRDGFDGAFLSLGSAAEYAERHSGRVKAFLESINLGNVVRIVESRFPCVAFFPISPLGRSYDPYDKTPFKPWGVVGPLLWLCYQTDALSETDTFQRQFVNFHLWLKRALLGHEGRGAQVGVFATLASAAGLVAALYLSLPTALFLLGGGMQALAIVCLYASLYWDWVMRRFR